MGIKKNLITKKTKAIMPVSLYGQTSNMDEINKNLKELMIKLLSHWKLEPVTIPPRRKPY